MSNVQTPAAPAAGKTLFSDFRISLVNKDSLRAIVSCKVADAFWLIGMRVVEGSRGRFVAMPSRKDTSGEFQDYYFPANKEVREHLQKQVLSLYEQKVAAPA